MIDTVYLESEIKNHFRALNIIDRLKPLRVIEIKSYQSIFNRKNQSYLLQKEKKALILAKKYESFFHKIKTKDSIGRDDNYYFSTMLNCPFSCKYCFLQGIYRSSYFVLFVNFEDFQKEIEKKILSTNKNLCFFSGYDTDILATDPISGFLDNFYPFFQKHKKTLFEIRTKSFSILPLMDKTPLDNLVIAFSLNPQIVIKKIELKTPSLENRLKAIKKLSNLGFQIGVRFDPIIYFEGFETEYKDFFKQVFLDLQSIKIHSITLGSIRYPFKYFENMKQKNVYPQFLASINDKSNNRYRYQNEDEILKFCKNQILKYFKQNLFIHN